MKGLSEWNLTELVSVCGVSVWRLCLSELLAIALELRNRLHINVFLTCRLIDVAIFFSICVILVYYLNFLSYFAEQLIENSNFVWSNSELELKSLFTDNRF